MSPAPPLWTAFGGLHGVEREIDTREMDAEAVRLAEHALGRECAADALAAAGRPGPIDRRPDGAPVWPAGAVGSIAHAAGRAVAVVGAACGSHRAVGVDLVGAEVFDGRLSAWVCRADDEHGAAGPLGPCAVFAVKESVFKAWSQATGGWLEFSDIRVRLGSTGRAAVELVDGRGAWAAGWEARDGVIRAIAVLADDARDPA